MSWIATPDQPPGDAGPNYARLFDQRPEVAAAWSELATAIRAGMGERRYELATVAAARRLRSSYCALAHGSVLAERHLDADAVVELMRDPTAAGLPPAEQAVVELADRVAAGAADMTEDDVARARAAGLSDDEVLDVVLAAAARMFFSSVLDALGAEPDAAYARLDPALRAALTVGRPIESTSGSVADRVEALYAAFNARDVDAVLAHFAPDADWPDAMRGTRVRGLPAVRAYWLAQWEVIDTQVSPRRVRELPDGRVEVLVEQVVRDVDGDELSHAFVLHTYTFTGPLVTRMDVGDPQA
jgi:uncharacterized peroxidase-related enzyme